MDFKKLIRQLIDLFEHEIDSNPIINKHIAEIAIKKSNVHAHGTDRTGEIFNVKITDRQSISYVIKNWFSDRDEEYAIIQKTRESFYEIVQIIINKSHVESLPRTKVRYYIKTTYIIKSKNDTMVWNNESNMFVTPKGSRVFYDTITESGQEYIVEDRTPYGDNII